MKLLGVGIKPNRTTNKNNNIKKIVRALQGTVGTDYNGTAHEYMEFNIEFDVPFKTPPMVHASIEMLDGCSEVGEGTRIWSKVESIGPKGAVVKIGAWNGYKIRGCKISWLALGE